jgi:putative ABC transport system permease protein
MFRLALKSTLARKLRLVSTGLAVVLGIAFLTGTLVFTDTIKRTFDDLFADIYAETDTFVRSSTSISMEFGGDARGRMPESVLGTVASVEGVADAQGVVQGFAQVVDAEGDAIGNPGQGAPTFGMSYVSGALSPWQLSADSRAPGPGELVLDKGAADKGDLVIGETVTVLTQTGPHEFPLVGIARFGSADSPGGATVAIFDLATAQEVLLGRAGELDAVMVDATEGVDEVDLTARVAAVLPDGVEALTGTQITEENQDVMEEGLTFFNTFLLVFAAIALVVACFTIYNTFQIVVTQRSREMALLRAVGASRRQVLAAQLLEAVVVGVLASVAGLAAGVFVAGLLKGMLDGFGIDIPAGGTVLQARTALVALVVGTLVTVVSAVFPAVRASRIPPLAALHDVVVGGIERPRRRLAYGGALTILGVVALTAGLAGAGIAWVGVGALAIFIGVFVLGPLVARPVVKVVGAPLPALAGITGSLARENALRNPKRTARTGGALMVGVALVAAITVMSASLKDWIRDVFEEQFTGDFVVATRTVGFGGLSPQLAAQLNELPEIDTATGIRVGFARVGQAEQSDEEYVSVDPATAGRVFDIGMLSGSVATLTTEGVLLNDSEAEKRDIGVDDTLDFQFLNGTTRTLTVQGIYSEQDLAGPMVISHALHEQSGIDQFDFSVYIVKASGVSDATAEAAIARVSDAYPNARLQSRSQYINDQAAQLDQIVNLMYGLLGLAVLIALFSIANSMALSIHERTRELGLLRAVGMTRRQTGSAVRWESVLVTLLGTGLGALVGIFFGWSISVTIRGEGLGTFSIPFAALAVVVVLAVFGGVIAALRPARRAARLDILQAIATE